MGSLSGFEKIVRRNVPLAPYTWFKIGGSAEYFAEPKTVDELAALVRRCCDEGLEIRLLGAGSNILVNDSGVKGVVAQLSHPSFCDVSVAGNNINAGGGAKLGLVISTAVREGLSGLETLVGIPGTIGGALHGNAGSRGGDIGQWTCRATVMTRTGEIVPRQREDLVFAYRQSSLDELVILNAQFSLEPGNPDELTKRMQKQWIIKKASQPLGHERSGCIFKNPRGMSAGMLIEQAGLKGARVGQAVISARHGNFAITADGATSEDVLGLIELVRTSVSERLGVELTSDIDIW